MPAVNLQPIEKPTGVRDRVRRAIHAAIISGEMVPGEVYSAPSLGARLGVSATPVREAMLDLAKEGLVERILNRGFRVTEVDEQYLDEITELRQLIEPPITRDVVGLIPAADIPALREAARKIVASAAANDLVAYTEIDTEFHLALLQYYGNHRILRLIKELRGQARLVGLAGLAKRGELTASAEDHVTIVDAIQAGDADLVYRLMVAHIDKTRTTWAGRDAAGREPTG